MTNCKPVVILTVAFALAACGKPAKPGQPAVPPPPATAAAQVGVSSGSQLGGALNAPGNYLRGMVGNIDRTKKALAASNQAAEERMNSDPTQETGN